MLDNLGDTTATFNAVQVSRSAAYEPTQGMEADLRSAGVFLASARSRACDLDCLPQR